MIAHFTLMKFVFVIIQKHGNGWTSTPAKFRYDGKFGNRQ